MPLFHSFVTIEYMIFNINRRKEEGGSEMITTLLLLSVIILLDLVVLSVDVLVLSIILTLIVYKYERKPKYDTYVYIVATILSLVSLFVNIEVISSGLIAFSMFTLVMFTGVIPNQWLMTKKLRTYRSFYSILGFIFILPHGYINLFVDQEINLFGIAAMVLMIPLFITSFNVVRKEMKVEEWNKLQMLAYIIYPVLFIHLISVSDMYGKVIYSIMMTLYINNKLLKEFRK